jgi:hypothetical protein
MSHICTPGVPKYRALRQSFEGLRLALSRYEQTGLPIDEQACKNLLATTTDQLTDYEDWLLTPIQYRDEQLVTSDALVLERLNQALKNIGKPEIEFANDRGYTIVRKHVKSLDFRDEKLPRDFDFSLLMHLSELREFICANNPELRTLPRFPEGLRTLHTDSLGLEEPPEHLPTSVEYWECSHNPKMGRLPALHEGLKILYCSDIGLTQPPRSLPRSLEIWDCSYNPDLKCLPTLHEGLTTLQCANIGLTDPSVRLPKSLLYCDISSNSELRHLPRLQADMDLRDLRCESIGLVDLPDDFLDIIPRTLEFLFLMNNPLSPDAKAKLRRLREERGIHVFFDE